MREIKPCPWCGEGVKLERIADLPLWRIHCLNEQCLGFGVHLSEFNSPEEAIEAWNTRYEPTCRMNETTFSNRTGDHVGTEYECSECKSHFGVKWRFCPSCGRRVIEE